jgi:hypothetical protein
MINQSKTPFEHSELGKCGLYQLPSCDVDIVVVLKRKLNMVICIYFAGGSWNASLCGERASFL